MSLNQDLDFFSIGSPHECSNCKKNFPRYRISAQGALGKTGTMLSCATCLGALTERCMTRFKFGPVITTDYAPPPPPKQTLEERRAEYEIMAYGETPEKAIAALGKDLEWGKLDDFSDLGGDADSEFEWGRRFTASGTGMKAAGWKVVGGVVLTWWK